MPDTTPKQPKPEQPQAPVANNLVPAKTNTGLIVGIIIGAAVLLVGLVIAIAVIFSSISKDGGKKSTNDNKTTDDEDAKRRAANAIAATSISNFGTVCQTASITNAAPYTKPYKVAAFYKDSSDRTYTNISLQYNAAYTVKSSNYTEANVVACATEKPGAAVKTATCDFGSGDNVKTIDYYATSYDVAVYEAKSGKKIKDLGTVSAPATPSSCPIFTTYNKKDPKIIAKPDYDALNALIAQFAQ